MTKDFSSYKHALEEERKVLEQELSTVGIVKDQRDPDEWEAKATDPEISPADPNELGDKVEAYEENAALIGKLETRLTEVDKALGKIEKGTYGLCEVCSQPIEEKRLKANPAATTCTTHLRS